MRSTMQVRNEHTAGIVLVHRTRGVDSGKPVCRGGTCRVAGEAPFDWRVHHPCAPRFFTADYLRSMRITMQVRNEHTAGIVLVHRTEGGGHLETGLPRRYVQGGREATATGFGATLCVCVCA